MTICDCDDYKLFKCLDCKCCTNCAYEYYMVHDSVWHEANPKDKGMLCIGCLESRLKRILKSEDFTGAPINYMASITGSSRIKSRLL